MLLAPVDIEQAVVGYLKPRLSVPVNYKLEPGVTGQVVVFTTGGVTRTMVSGAPRVMVDCYAARDAGAIALVNQTWGFINDLDGRALTIPGVGLVQFYDVENSLPVNLPHPDRPDLARRQFNSLIHIRHQRVS